MKEACLVFDVLQQAMNLTVFDRDLNTLKHISQKKKLVEGEVNGKIEDLPAIEKWVLDQYENLKSSNEFKIIAINFSSYIGALVHLNDSNEVIYPVLDINRPLGYKTTQLAQEIFDKKKGQQESVQLAEFSFETAALQLLFLKQNQPEIFGKIKKTVSIAQYLQSVFSKQFFHDYTTISCHSAAWDFENQTYHEWIKEQKLDSLVLPLVKTNQVTKKEILIGPGIYYKVAETIPFLAISDERFILLSTGAWTVCTNPFNHSEVKTSDLKRNCFNVLNHEAKQIKMARLFSGNEHTRQISHLAEHFGCESNFYLNVAYDSKIVKDLRRKMHQATPNATALGAMNDSPFMDRNLNNFSSIEEAYHQFIMDLMAQQVASIKLTIGHQPPINHIYVEGGLGKNEIFMQLLSEAFHDKRVYKVGFKNTAAMGAAMVIGDSWGARTPDKELLKIELIE